MARDGLRSKGPPHMTIGRLGLRLGIGLGLDARGQGARGATVGLVDKDKAT